MVRIKYQTGTGQKKLSCPSTYLLISSWRKSTDIDTPSMPGSLLCHGLWLNNKGVELMHRESKLEINKYDEIIDDTSASKKQGSFYQI